MDSTKLVGILADGAEWQDADGRTAWPVYEVNTLAELLESQGYHTSLFPAGVAEAADAAIAATIAACTPEPMTAPIPDNAFWRRMALGHYLRTGHELAGYLTSTDGAIWELVRQCPCEPAELAELAARQNAQIAAEPVTCTQGHTFSGPHDAACMPLVMAEPDAEPDAGSVPGCCELGVTVCPQHGEDAECVCLPGAVCARCRARGYRSGLAGYAERIYPDSVTADDIETERMAELGADRIAERMAMFDYVGEDL